MLQSKDRILNPACPITDDHDQNISGIFGHVLQVNLMGVHTAQQHAFFATCLYLLAQLCINTSTCFHQAFTLHCAGTIWVQSFCFRGGQLALSAIVALTLA